MELLHSARASSVDRRSSMWSQGGFCRPETFAPRFSGPVYLLP
jgi:hypothetical protein